MPQPIPREDESEQEFVSRCVKEEKDHGNDDPTKQILAMCYQIYKDSKNDNKSKSITKNRFFKEGDVVEIDGKIGIIKRIVKKVSEK